MNALRKLSFALPAEVWLVQTGMFLNYLGWGCVMPFEVIYLHDGRHLSLAVAGLVVGVVTGLAVVAAPAAGPLIDRAGARHVAALAGVALATGYTGLAVAHTSGEALMAAALAGAGNGALIPSQSALILALVAPDVRHRATAVSRVSSNLGAALGSVIGGIVGAYGVNGFMALYIANAATYLLYVLVLLAAVREDPCPQQLAGGYRLVVRDGAFMRLAFANVGVIAVGWGVFTWIVPAYAHERLGVSVRLTGLLLLGNALAVVLAQIPVARLAEGRRRTVAMAVGALTFAVASLAVAITGRLDPRLAYGVIVVAAIAVGVGECLYAVVLTPLVVALAPPAIRGRYLGAISLSWWLGLGAAPTVGAALLSVSPAVAMLTAAGVALAAALSLLSLERELPTAVRLTPRPAATAVREP